MSLKNFFLEIQLFLQILIGVESIKDILAQLHKSII